MDEKTLVDLETRLAFAERGLEKLNDALADQQTQLDRLGKSVDRVLARLETITPVDDAD